MSEQRIRLPALLRRTAASLGPPGERWLAALPRLVADLERRWAITVGPPLSGGSWSYVARAETMDGRPAVLKLALPGAPGPGFTHQVRTLTEAGGVGYVRVLAADLERRAMLQEALGPPMDQLGLPPESQIEALCATLREAWRLPRPPDATLAQAQGKAHDLGAMVARLWEELDRPCSEGVLTHALELAERRAADTDLGRVVVVHGDPHPGNALRAPADRPGSGSGFVFVDPDGFLADPSYDLGVVLRDWRTELQAPDARSVAGHYCRLLASHTGINAEAIWEWGFLERVSSGLFCISIGSGNEGRAFLDTAEMLLTG